MRWGRYLMYLGVAALVGIVCWNTVTIYFFTKKQLHEQVEQCIKKATDTIQNYNGSLLNNFALCLTDKHYSEKVAFAAGFTHNWGKIAINFIDSEVDKTARPEGKNAGNVPVITKKYFEDHKISFLPNSAMTVRHFDSCFKRALANDGLHITYSINVAKRNDTTNSRYTVSAPFILSFTEPTMYNLHYNISVRQILGHMVPYTLATVGICLLLVLGALFFYRNYVLHAQLLQFRETVLGNVTHELKTPLASLQLIMETAAATSDGDGFASVPGQHLHFAEKEIYRMKLLVDRILSVSKMGRQQFILDKQPTSLAKVITDAVSIMELSTTAASGVIYCDLSSSAIIGGDGLMLTNAVNALIDNALKYTYNAPQIHIRLYDENAKVVMSVQDNGVGIAAQHKRKIFEPFYRINSGSLIPVAGHGLGLYFVQQVMRQHIGTVHFVSGSAGTTFFLTFHNSVS